MATIFLIKYIIGFFFCFVCDIASVAFRQLRNCRRSEPSKKYPLQPLLTTLSGAQVGSSQCCLLWKTHKVNLHGTTDQKTWNQVCAIEILNYNKKIKVIIMNKKLVRQSKEYIRPAFKYCSVFLSVLFLHVKQFYIFSKLYYGFISSAFDSLCFGNYTSDFYHYK